MGRSALSKLMLLFMLAAGVTTVAAGEKMMLMEDVKTLTLRKGRQTRGRRSTAPQLECVSGPCHEAPSVVQCRNVGSDGIETQWKCEGEFSDPGLSFDQNSLVMNCEGYNYPDDDYITAGSCGLQFSVIDRRSRQSSSNYNSYGGGSYGGGYDGSYHSNGYSDPYSYSQSSSFNIWGFVFVGLVVYLIYAACTSSGNRNAGYRRGGGGGDYGGGGPGYGGGNGGYGGGSCGNNNYHRGGNGGGFWQGLGLGGLAGYMMGGRRGYGYGGYRRRYGGYNGGMRFGGNRGGGMRFGGGARAAPRMATGFAGTRRR